MSRIRTVKPDFFRHEELFEAEKKYQLPLRLAFAGLWTCCDREGRFRWKPRQLKLDIIPYDDIDFSRVLDALATRGFVVKYEIAGEVYGYIPSWNKHQVINPREKASDLPPPQKNFPASLEPQQNQGLPRDDDASMTREARDSEAHVRARGEEEGEKEREEENIKKENTKRKNKPPGQISEKDRAQFEEAWKKYPAPSKGDKQYALIKFAEMKKIFEKDPGNVDHDFLSVVLLAIDQQHTERIYKQRYGHWCPEWKNFTTWLNKKCWQNETNLNEEFWKNEKDKRNVNANSAANIRPKSKTEIMFDLCAPGAFRGTALESKYKRRPD